MTESIRRLLIVDDEPRNLDLLEAHLAPLGHSISRADSGREALEVLEHEGADLVLLDVMMPGFDGIDVLTHLRAREVGSYLPVILVTAQTDREARLRGLEAGADDFLEKPVDRHILLARVRTLLRLRAALEDQAERNAALERVQREQREFADFLVHDMKNPLAVAYASVAWVRSCLSPDAGEILDAISDAERATQRLRAMVEDLLAVARLEEPGFPLRLEDVPVRQLIHEVVTSHAREATERGIAVEIAVEGEPSLQADRALLRRMVENLFENAVRHTPAGGRIALAARGAPESEIVVSNTGWPIPPEHHPRLFEKYWRGAGGRRDNVGLGLYFCRRAAEAHGATIAVTERSPWPVSFAIRFPARP